MIFSPSKLETKDVETNSASAQLAAFISRGGGNHLSEEDLEEELQIKDPGQDDVVENFADCAKPQAAGSSWRLLTSHKALQGPRLF